VSFTDQAATEALCDSVDFLWIDLEHTPIDFESLQGHLIAARAGGAPALVRVPSGAVAWVKRTLDIGAEGVILPQARSVAEIEGFVSACRYPPHGQRGFGPRRPTNYGRMGLKDYFEVANRSVFVVVQIETMEAFRELDTILRIPGIDSLVIGPADLAGSMGVPGELRHPRVLEAIGTVSARARKAGLFVGIGMGPDAEYAEQVARLGVQWIQCGGDCSFMVQGIDRLYQQVRSRLSTGT
jgi:2-dehydro-3-deoxyglucarate aldolase/4-hydroxy-2-oxoheptanedioate aldolase